MPTMPRFDKKGTKVAFKILGTPENFLFKPTKKQEEVRKQLVFQETTRAK